MMLPACAEQTVQQEIDQAGRWTKPSGRPDSARAAETILHRFRLRKGLPVLHRRDLIDPPLVPSALERKAQKRLHDLPGHQGPGDPRP